MRTFLALSLLLSPAAADVLVVDASGGGDFATIGDALNGSTESDLLLVKAGTYPGFDIVDRSATIIGTQLNVNVTGRILVRDLQVNDRVLLSGLRVFSTLSFPTADPDFARGLVVRDCLGPVRVQDSVFRAPFTSNGPNDISNASRPLHGAVVEFSTNVSLVRCETQGGTGDRGLYIYDSSLALSESRFEGGRAWECWPGGSGAFQLGEVHLFDSGSSFIGEDGENVDCSTGYGGFSGTDGGSGLSAFQPPPQSAVSLSTNLHESELLFGIGGFGVCSYYGTSYNCDGQNGQPVSPSNFVPNFLRGPRRDASFPVRVQEGSYLEVSLLGEVGDEALLVLSQEGPFVPSVSRKGVQLAGAGVPGSIPDRVIELGTLPSAHWSVSVAIPLQGSNFEHQTWFAQVVFVDVQQEAWYGSGRFLTIEDDEDLDSEATFCFAGEVEGSTCGVCPCANSLSPGNWGGCRNGNGTSCRLVATGEASLTGDTLSFGVTGAGTDTAALLNSADNRLPAMGACPIGSGIGMGSGMDGLRCIGGSLLRHGVRGVDIDGNSINPWGLGSPNPPGGVLASAGFAVGQTRHFQVFYRDNFQAGCQTALNTSNGVSVTVAP